MRAILFATALLLMPTPGDNHASKAGKKELTDLLEILPTDGEFYTEEAISQGQPYLPVLLSLTQADIRKDGDLFPYLALSRGLCGRAESREYVVVHFAEVQHPLLKLFWAAILFDQGAASPEIVSYLRKALDSKKQANRLAEMVGPEFEQFRERVRAPRRDQ